jgi:hypothetical protein
MPLTFRRSGLSRDPKANDWVVLEDGVDIGRIYEVIPALTADVEWFWEHQLLGPATGKVQTHGRAATFEDAKTQFGAAVQAFRRWRPT